MYKLQTVKQEQEKKRVLYRYTVPTPNTQYFQPWEEILGSHDWALVLRTVQYPSRDKGV